MRQQDKLGKTLREYYDNREEPFNDDEWERASAYLNAARRKSRIRTFLLVFAALFSALLLTLFNAPELIRDQKQTASLPGQRVKPLPTRQAAILPVPASVQGRKITSSHPGPDKMSGDVAAVISSSGASGNSGNVPNDLSPARTRETSGHGTATQVPHVVKKGNRVSETNAITPDLKEALATGATPVRTTTSPEAAVQEKPVNGGETQGIRPAPETPAKDQNQFPAKETYRFLIDGLPQATEALVLNDQKNDPGQADSSRVTIAAKASVPASPDTSCQWPLVPIAAPAENASRDSLPVPASKDLVAGEGIFYEAGSAWLYGWKGPVERDARGFSPIAGIHYLNRLTRRYAFSFGVQYLQVRNLSNSSRTSRVFSYVYGEQNRVTVITPSTLHYLVVPLRFHYYRDQRNSFGAGINLAYLLNVDATVTSYDEKPGSHENYETIKQSGYTEGFTWFDSQLAFFYRRRLGSSMALQAELFLGLTDVKHDAFFRLSHKERNSGAKLSFIYYAFRKNGRP